jgi:nicotinamide-nucleotide amidase
MKAMFDQTVLAFIQSQAAGRCALSRRLLCFGIPEAKLGDLLADLMVRDRNPLVGTTASEAVLSVRILATGADPLEAARKLDADAATVRERLGPLIFGEDEQTLAGAVAELLTTRRRTVATAESCTGGLLAKNLTDTPGSSVYFLRGFVVYSNEAKVDDLGIPAAFVSTHGAVSEEVARAMALACRRKAASDFAISITGIAGPAGGSKDKPVGLVFIGLASSDSCEIKRVLLGDHLTRAEVRDRACKSALNMLRLRLLEGHQPGLAQ